LFQDLFVRPENGFIQHAVMRARLPTPSVDANAVQHDYHLARKRELYLPGDRQVMYDACEPSPERAEVLEIIGGQSAHGGLSKLSIFSRQLSAPISSEWKRLIVETQTGSHCHAFLSYRSIHATSHQQPSGKSDAESR
jgi:hypothetical protein